MAETIFGLNIKHTSHSELVEGVTIGSFC